MIRKLQNVTTMGQQSVNTFDNPESKKHFTRLLLNDIRALDRMLKEGLIESDVQRIGAEQELVLLTESFSPSMNNGELLQLIDDPHFVPELAKFNIEANLDPQEFTGSCFALLEDQLRTLLNKAHHAAESIGTRLLMTGILPTIRQEHLHFEYMTPNPRYRTLNEVMRANKGSDFELNIMAVDELITTHSNILFEACNTSFQVHLQVSPDRYISQYNWAQMIAGPIMAISANSPLLLGKRLWKETRISLFQQSVDTRPVNIQREQQPRVTFGKEWARGSAADLFKDNVSRFAMLFATDEKEDALEALDQGKVPELEALRLHNGTVYKWNRACYGVGNGKPHLRIENRYLPSGPTVKDEMANAAFWLGVMNAMPEEYANLPELAAFEDCRYNFYNAARNGMDCQFRWFGKTVSAQKLIRTVFLPLAKEGLEKAGIDAPKIEELIGIIAKRLERSQNGAKWMVRNFTALLDRSTPSEASRNITRVMYENQMSSKPVHLWKDLDPEKFDEMKQFGKVRDIMERDLVIVKEDDLIELAVSLMDWKSIRSIPVENANHEVVGLITVREILHYHGSQKNAGLEFVRDIMRTDFVSVDDQTSTQEAVTLLADNRACCVLVTKDKSLCGIVTESDIVQVAKMTKAFNK